MLTDKILQQIKNVEIEVESYGADSRALHTLQEEIQRRESLIRDGLINPIIITESENIANLPNVDNDKVEKIT